MTATVTQVAWRRSASRYNFGPATAIHLLPEGETKTLCGVEVPKEALPGYQAPSGQLYFEVRAIGLDVTDPEDFYNESTGECEQRACKRCARKATA